jgi:excisionase family DNA binding protein
MDKQENNDRLTLTPVEVAALLGCSRGTAYKMCRTGAWPTIRIGRKMVVPRRAVERLIAAAEARADAVAGAARTEMRYT